MEKSGEGVLLICKKEKEAEKMRGKTLGTALKLGTAKTGGPGKFFCKKALPMKTIVTAQIECSCVIKCQNI